MEIRIARGSRPEVGQFTVSLPSAGPPSSPSEGLCLQKAENRILAKKLFGGSRHPSALCSSGWQAGCIIASKRWGG
jgi:hypothetical protein